MDIISAHQLGLLEQLEADASSLAGRAGDHHQRAVVLYHLFDHSGGAHDWALAEAVRELHLAAGVCKLWAWLDRWGWTVPDRVGVTQAMETLVASIGLASRQRCMAAYRAYRVTAVAALKGEAGRFLGPELFTALAQCHQCRRAGEALADELRECLFGGSEQLAGRAVEADGFSVAWNKVESSRARRVARKLLGAKPVKRSSVRPSARTRAKMERMLMRSPLLPASFRANPSQHFFTLQFGLAQRRRKQLHDYCDAETGAFGLAA